MNQATKRRKNAEYQATYRAKRTEDKKSQDALYAKCYSESMEGRCRHALAKSRYEAKQRGHRCCEADLDELIRAFTGECHICKETEHSRKLHMDHCHTTGKFRGWLCYRCNYALGLVHDDKNILGKLIDYLT